MNRLRQITVETYDQSAPQLAEYFRGIGPREKNIDHVLELLGSPPEPRIVEIGCGDGRDAKAIVARTPNYIGFDISSGMIDLAQKHVPEGNFVVADAADFEFPDGIDAVFAFASLLHLDKYEFKAVLDRAHQALKPQGIFYLSLKHSEKYHAEIKNDDFGERLFYFYDEPLVRSLAEEYQVISSEIETIGSTDWLEMALRRL